MKGSGNCIECTERAETPKSLRCKDCKRKKMKTYTKAYYQNNRLECIRRTEKWNEVNGLNLKKYRLNNSKRIREYQKKYREDHLHAIKAKLREYRILHREKLKFKDRMYQKKYREKNRDAIRARQKLWYINRLNERKSSDDNLKILQKTP